LNSANKLPTIIHCPISVYVAIGLSAVVPSVARLRLICATEVFTPLLATSPRDSVTRSTPFPDRIASGICAICTWVALATTSWDYRGSTTCVILFSGSSAGCDVVQRKLAAVQHTANFCTPIATRFVLFVRCCFIRAGAAAASLLTVSTRDQITMVAALRSRASLRGITDQSHSFDECGFGFRGGSTLDDSIHEGTNPS